MKKVFSLIKRAGKAYCKAYVESCTFKLPDGKTIYCNATSGIAYVA